jgi:hypothetical protein
MCGTLKASWTPPVGLVALRAAVDLNRGRPHAAFFGNRAGALIQALKLKRHLA